MVTTKEINELLKDCSTAVKKIILFSLQSVLRANSSAAYAKAQKVLDAHLGLREYIATNTEKVSAQQEKQRQINEKRLSLSQREKNHARNVRRTARKKEWLTFSTQFEHA